MVFGCFPVVFGCFPVVFGGFLMLQNHVGFGEMW